MSRSSHLKRVLLSLCSKRISVVQILAIGLLSACGLHEPHTNDDVIDSVRSIDLLPRFPQLVGDNVQQPRGGIKPTIYNGVASDGAGNAAAGAVPTVPGAQPAAGGEGFDLNFEATPISTVAKVMLGDVLGAGYTIDPRVQGTVTLASVHPVPKSEIPYVLENALKLNGVALVHDSTGYRLVPMNEASGSGGVDPGTAQPGYGISVVSLQFVSAQSALKLIDSFAARPGTVRADGTRNLLLVQGTGPERRSVIDTVASFDVDWMRGQSVGIFPVQNSALDPMIAELTKIFRSGDNETNQHVITFQPITRMNAVLAISAKPALLKSAEKWIARLDRTDMTRSSVQVYHVKYGEAKQLARVLNDIFGNNSRSSLQTETSATAPGSGSALSASERLGVTPKGSSSSSGSPFGTQQQGSNGLFGNSQSSSTLGTSSNSASADTLASRTPGGGIGLGSGNDQPIIPGLRITPDTVNNTLLIYASQQDYQLIQRTLDQIDRPELQVAINATIAEVTLNDELQYGVQFYLTSHNVGLQPDTGSALNTAGQVSAAGVAQTFLSRTVPGFNFLVGPESQPNMILNALHNVTSIKVLSSPSLVVVDNQVASLQVGDQVPVQTGTATVLSTSNTIANTIDYKDTGIILRVTPRINVNGNVRLDIEQEISNVATTTTATLTPTISQRIVKSSISVASGQTVLLAGLISEQHNGSRSGIPVVDEIPIIRDIANSSTDNKATRTELIIFIRPQIIRDSVDAHVVAEELRSKLRGTVSADRGWLPRLR